MTVREWMSITTYVFLILIFVDKSCGYEDVVVYETTNLNHDLTKSHIAKAICSADYIYRNYEIKSMLGCDIIKGRKNEVSVGWIPLRCARIVKGKVIVNECQN